MRALFQFIALTTTGLLAGTFFYALVNVVPAFYEVPMPVHLTFRTQLMNHNGTLMPALMILAMLSAILCAMGSRGERHATSFALFAAGLALTSLLVTRFGNVPINQLIRTWSPLNPPDDAMVLLRRWDRYHLIRCLAAIGSFFFMLLAAFGHRNSLREKAADDKLS